MENINREIIYKAEPYTGTNISNSFGCRVGWQVTAYDKETGKRVYAFETGNRHKTPCLKSSWVFSHHRSGCSKADYATLMEYKEWAIRKAAELNNDAVAA
jgi:hypothetical protein